MEQTRNAWSALLAAGLLSACSPTYDLQGNDPREYYAAHPKVNTVEEHQTALELTYAPNAVSPEAASLMEARQQLADLSPASVRKAEIAISGRTLGHDAATNTNGALGKKRAAWLQRWLKTQGVAQAKLYYIEDYSDRATIALTHSVAIPPRCPDWRGSPVVNYSNANNSNFGCANNIALGKMVADPQDLIRGSGNAQPDSERNALVIEQTRSPAAIGVTSAAAAAPTPTTTGASSGGSTQ